MVFLPDHVAGLVIIPQDRHIGIAFGGRIARRVIPAFADHAALGILGLHRDREACGIVHRLAVQIIGRSGHRDTVRADHLFAVCIGFARQHHQAAVHVIIAHRGYAAVGVVLIDQRSIAIGDEHGIAVQIKIRFAQRLAFCVISRLHRMVAIGIEDRRAMQVVGGFNLASVLVPDLMQLIRAAGIGKGLLIDIVIFGYQVLSVFIVFIQHFGIALFAGRKHAAFIQEGFGQDHALAAQRIQHLMIAVSAACGIAVSVKVFLQRQVPAIAVGIMHLGIAQLGHDHFLIIFIVIGGIHQLFAAVKGIGHLGPAVGGQHTLAVGAEIAFTGHPIHGAVSALHSGIAILQQIGRIIGAEILDQHGINGAGLVGIDCVCVAIGARGQLILLVIIALLDAFPVGIFAPHAGKAILFAVKQLAIRTVKSLGLQIMIVFVGVFDGGIALRPGHEIAVGVLPALLQQAAHVFIHDELRCHFGKQRIGTQQLIIRAVIDRFDQRFIVVLIGLAGIALRPDHRFALDVVIDLLDHAAPGIIGDSAFGPALSAVDALVRRVIKGGAHQALVPVLIAGDGIAQIIGSANRA